MVGNKHAVTIGERINFCFVGFTIRIGDKLLITNAVELVEQFVELKATAFDVMLALFSSIL